MVRKVPTVRSKDFRVFRFYANKQGSEGPRFETRLKTPWDPQCSGVDGRGTDRNSCRSSAPRSLPPGTSTVRSEGRSLRSPVSTKTSSHLPRPLPRTLSSVGSSSLTFEVFRPLGGPERVGSSIGPGTSRKSDRRPRPLCVLRGVSVCHQRPSSGPGSWVYRSEGRWEGVVGGRREGR